MIFKKVELSVCLEQVKDTLDIQNDIEYKQITVSNTWTIKLRWIKKWITIWTKRQFYTKKWFFIYSRLWLHTGAFWIVPDFLDWAIVTWDMPVFKINEDIILKEFLILALNTDFYKNQVDWLNKWVAQSRIREKIFLNLKINIPEIEEQRVLLEKYNIIKYNYDKFEDINTKNQNYIKLLKQSILQEAIEWKLTKSWREKNKDIEPASVLLEKIKAEKEELIKQKKLKKQKELNPILEDEIPFYIPESWEWCRLGDILSLLTDYHANWWYETLKNNVTLLDNIDYAIMVRITNLWKKPSLSFKYISENAYNFLNKSKLYLWDIVMSKITDPWSVYLVNDFWKPMSLAMNLFLLRFNENIDSMYSYYYMDIQKDYIQSFSAWTATKTITKDSVKNLLFPIPPLSEQKEIVKKVDELLKLCEELEKQTLETKENSENLMKAVLGEVFSK